MAKFPRLCHVTTRKNPLQAILRTKLYSPHLGADLVKRGRLLDWMNRVEELPFTLVSAPAGYGKSVLAGQWAARSKMPVAWVSLDGRDSDLKTFLDYLLAAVSTIAPGSCAETQVLLKAESLPPLQTVVAYLLNDLQALETAGVLVLDDYHRIDATSPVHELMRHLLEHPPQQLRFVIVTRKDPPLPLGNLRASGQMHEVRLQDLRFTKSEIAELLNAASELALSDDAITNLQNEMEGWAVGLRLVTLALRNTADPEAFIKGMRGGLPAARSYLLQEVLASLAPGMREYLLASSILDRFCKPLLEAIGEVIAASFSLDMTAEDLIRQLQRDNLFTLSLDIRGEWFRYHHLFQELLQEELGRTHGAEFFSELHTRTSEWFEASGLIDEALKHALASGNTESAAQIVIRHRMDALNADHWYVLEQWLSRLPESTLHQHTELLLARAWIYLHQSRWELLVPVMEQADSLLGNDPAQDDLFGELELFRGYMLFFLGQGAQSLGHIKEALKRIPRTFYEARAQCEVIFALSSQMVGQTSDAVSGLNDLVKHYDSPEDLRKTRLLVSYVFIHFIAGDLSLAEMANERLRAVAVAGNYAYAIAWSDYMQGQIHLCRHELDAAVSYLERSVEKRFIHFKRAAVDSLTALMLAQQASGRFEEAEAALGILRDYVGQLNDPALWVFVDSSTARLSILQGRIELANNQIATDLNPGGEAMIWWLELPPVTRCRALLAAGTDEKTGEAQTLLKQLIEAGEAQHNTFHLIQVLCLQSNAFDQQGKTEPALASLDRAVSLARPGGFVFPFVEPGKRVEKLLKQLRQNNEHKKFIDHLLAAFKMDTRIELPTSSTVNDSTRWDLTNRELDILELLAQRMQNKEIANKLFISTHTVKDHLKHIYQKLGVSNRRQAVAKAVKNGVITPQ